MKKRWAYFDVTGELLLDVFQRISDLPIDIKLLKVEMAPTDLFARDYPFNKIRFLVESNQFEGLEEGAMIIQIMPTCTLEKLLSLTEKGEAREKMIINELIERECCDEIKDFDLSPMQGKGTLRWWERVFTCRHCGRKWKWESYMDAAGGRSKRLVKTKG